MRDFIELGSAPSCEECVQLDKNKPYLDEMREECFKYKQLLIKMFPEGWFNIKTFHHDFGDYLEVVIWYDNEDEKQVEYAYMVEANLPEYWENGNESA
jgi:hypothetical protein